MRREILKELVEISNKYGQNEDFVLAGGGNTSFKDNGYMYIKAAGAALSEITADGFVKMSQAELSSIWEKSYPEDGTALEAHVMHDVLRSRAINEDKRPSAETLLHSIIPYKYVVHLHPALINGITCARDGEAVLRKLFSDAVVICDCVTGFALASKARRELETYRSARGADAKVIFLKNHGVFVAADTVAEIDAIYALLCDTVKENIKALPDMTAADVDLDRASLIAPALRMFLREGETSVVAFFAEKAGMEFVTEAGFNAIKNPFTPDYITYCNKEALFVKADADIDRQYELLSSAISAYKEKNGCSPKIVAVENLGFFAHGMTKKDADTARSLMRDAIKIAAVAKAFGGASAMPQDVCDLIASQNGAKAEKSCLRAAEKIVIVTGGAQGIGFGIASEITENGANVVIADLNDVTADAAAASLCEKFGAGKAISCKTDVSNEQSVAELVRKTVLEFGGLDALVNNAGIVRAGSLEEMTVENLDFVTKINYTAYFICAKYASRVMKLQNRFAPDYFMDIIQINSKSGLSGSNKNFAYAGSKFGGIGLTQSFALELVPYNIKVNSICPGNFLEGPLWTDPVKGLFVQYLNAGKVPGAKTVDDVRRSYESKVPMNRGCRVPDVARAVLYCMEQQYETGQAIPVTGGQNMLK